MKLSMWMIANRLSSLDMVLDIKNNAPVVLKSARRVYATNCVHVYREGEDLVCSGEGDTIRVHNMDVTQGVEIIQSVFDYFQDWADQLIQLIRRRDYQGVIDLAWQVFQNPMMILDGNSRVLAITRQYPADSLDEEWAYLCQYGYTSLNAMQQMRNNHTAADFWQHGTQSFRFSRNKTLAYNGISYCLYCNDAVCGRITVLEKERATNPGDWQLLEYIAAMLEPSLGQIYYESFLNNTNVFYNILFGNAYDEKLLETQLEYQGWNADDCYYLALAEIVSQDGRGDPDRSLDLVMQVILQQVKNCIVMKKQPYILMFSNRNLRKDPAMQEFFRYLEARNPVKVSFSLPCKGIEQAGYLYAQAAYAAATGKMFHPQDNYYDFFDYAIDYIVESDSLIKSVHACMPAVIQLWEQSQVNGDELFHTLKIFLDNERSVSRASTALFTHRNTVLYRIRKIQEILEHSLDDAYARKYCQLSVDILELYQQKHRLL